MFSDELTHQAESTTFPLLSLLIQRALCGVDPFAALIHEGAACLVAEPAAYLAYLAYLVWFMSSPVKRCSVTVDTDWPLPSAGLLDPGRKSDQFQLR